MVFLSKGNGGLDEIDHLLTPDSVVYIIFGHVAEDAEYSVIKFIFITWVGPKVKPMHKARSSQHRVSLYNFTNVCLFSKSIFFFFFIELKELKD